MKKIDGSFITSAVGMPFKSGTLAHLQSSYQEVLGSILQNIIGAQYDPSKVYILFGCVNSGSGLSYIISGGAVFFNGEVYLVDATSFVSPGGQVAVGNVAQTFFTDATADPVEFTDGATHNVHQIRKFVFASAAPGSGSADFTNCIPIAGSGMAKILVAAFGTAYLVNFLQDQAVFFTTGLANSATGLISFDFNGARPGSVVSLKVVAGTSSTLNIDTPAGSAIINLVGTPLQSKTNYIDFEYMGINEGGNHEVRYSVTSL